jgi:hypothetical protein
VSRVGDIGGTAGTADGHSTSSHTDDDHRAWSDTTDGGYE